MNSTTKALVFALFIGCSAIMLYSPNFASGKTQGENNLPPQATLPNVQRPMFVEFFSQSCGICKDLEPTLASLEKEYSDRIEFVKIDSENPANYELSEMFGVYGLPSMHWITTGKIVSKTHEGAISEADLRAAMDALISGDTEDTPDNGDEAANPHGEQG